MARFPLELTDADVEFVARISGAHDLTRLSPLGLFLFKGPPSRIATQQLIDRLWYSGVAVRVEPNTLTGRLTAFTPNDTHFGNQWYHEQASDIDLDSTAAWEITRGSSEVVVAATDTGVDVDHPEFAGRLFVNPGEIPGNGLDDDGNSYVDDVHGWSPIADPPNGDVNDLDFGHGTWVGSVLLAKTDNAFQVAGMDHLAKLLPIKMVTTTSPEVVEMAAMVAGLEYLLANPGFAQIINMSVAQYTDQEQLSMLYDALSAAAETHILIGGSGNTSGPHACRGLPNGHPDVITVGGTTATDDRAAFSSFGSCVDFAAPAEDIYTASFADPNNPSAFHVGAGTSFAAPLVAGIASLGLSIWPNMGQSELYNALKDSAVDLGPVGKDDEFGWGRVNAYEALDRMQRIFEDGFETGDTSAWN